ncbi:SDR family NAD(P)-dependent oxidoreductase [Comamonas composti]|uniref:SDR family NAD(P)-dependent oxidoreductase n=1 Tax=Comamonas composti TaxID=408558 RepID=UPI000427D0AC|nr:glucose 1-dehydrogenase [Comamonas composti]
MLKNKVALITGAASGIGQAIALTWAREGARVVVSDINAEAGQQTADLVRDLGGEAFFLQADAGSAIDHEELVAQTLRHFGRLDVACNNAGIGGAKAATADYPLDAWEQVLRINLSGVFYGCKYQIAAMLQNGGGSIINMASILGAVGFAGSPAYVAAKHGVLGLTKTAALEYAVRGVRVNAVGPAFIETPLIERLKQDEAAYGQLVGAHPAGRLGKAEEVAELVTWLASDKASFVTGSYYPVDGGYLAR